jgi:hypothetical protein
MPANTTVDTEGSKSILVKTTGHEKLRITGMLSVLAVGRPLTPFILLKEKNLPKQKLPTGIRERMDDGRSHGQMAETVWHRRPGALLKKTGMLVLDAFKGHLTEKVKTIASNMLSIDQVIIPGGMTPQL